MITFATFPVLMYPHFNWSYKEAESQATFAFLFCDWLARALAGICRPVIG